MNTTDIAILNTLRLLAKLRRESRPTPQNTADVRRQILAAERALLQAERELLAHCRAALRAALLSRQ